MNFNCFASPEQLMATRADLAVMLLRAAKSLEEKIERKMAKKLERAKAQSSGAEVRRLRGATLEDLEGIVRPRNAHEAMMQAFEE